MRLDSDAAPPGEAGCCRLLLLSLTDLYTSTALIWQGGTAGARAG